MPPAVLPITRGGIALTDRVCWLVLAVAMAIAAALILYFNRGSTFLYEEATLLYQTGGLDLRGVIEPHEGHLVATSRLVYKAVLEAVGAEYVVFRVVHVLALIGLVGVLYALIKRRIGAVAALAPAFVLLLFGSAWSHLIAPAGFGIFVCIAAGLGALLALERDTRGGDVVACLLLVLSLVTYTIALAFLVGVAISVLLRDDRWRRAWIFLMPLTLYAAWWLWALSEPSSPTSEAKLSNILLVPAWSADSLAVVAAALVGLGYEFADGSPPGVDPGWGRVLAVVAVVALALVIRRRRISLSLWTSLGIVLAFWALGALAAEPARTPDTIRNVFMGTVGVVLVATDGARSIRFTRAVLIALFAACAVSLATNVAMLRDAGAFVRNGSSTARAQLAMVELARDRVDPGFRVAADDPDSQLAVGGATASTYLSVVDRYGSPAFSLGELERQPEDVREAADRALASALGLGIERGAPDLRADDCAASALGAGVASFGLPEGGATLRVSAAAPTEVMVRRFATNATAEVGKLQPGERATLRIPPDDSPRPWRVWIEGVSTIQICPLS